MKVSKIALAMEPMTALLLRVAPHAQIYVGKIAHIGEIPSDHNIEDVGGLYGPFLAEKANQ
jgi:hypothetical protein